MPIQESPANCVAALKSVGVQFEPGLTAAEFKDIEAEYKITFPPDLREFLSIGQPISDRWINWRDKDSSSLTEILSWPYEGMCVDIEDNNFWLKEWGDRPSNLQSRYEIAKQAVASAPQLIPIYSHRYIPNRPDEAGNPVMSVHQTDIIYYGSNLAHYFENEFGCFSGQKGWRPDDEYRWIEFWSHLIEDYEQIEKENRER